MSTGFTEEEEDIYYETSESVQRCLRKTRNPADLLAVVRLAYKGFERAFESAPAEAKAAIACRAGCGTCCHERVGVQAHEVLIAAEHVQMHFPPAELDAVIARAAAHRSVFAGRAMPAWTPPKTPCVLLHDGSCSIYAMRPAACRSHHSHSLAGCITNLAAGYEQVHVAIRGLRGRMFAVMLGIDQAFEQAGFDEQAYDFGSALHEALTNSLCAVRWRQRQPAFPVDCREVTVGQQES